MEVTKEEDWNTLLRMEEEYIENICAQIVAFHPDIVITEKGVSDLAQHYLMKADITVRVGVKFSFFPFLFECCGVAHDRTFLGFSLSSKPRSCLTLMG